MRPVFVKVKVACGMLSISRATLYRLIKNGTLADHKIGGTRIIMISDIEALTFESRILRKDVLRDLMLALKFYADPINHARTQVNHPQSVCAQDAGLLARATLKRIDDNDR